MRLLLRSCYQCLVLHNILTTMKPSSAFTKNILPNNVRASSTTSTIPAAAAAPKEICETQITPTTGQASILCTVSNSGDSPRSSLWSDVAINAAKQFTITQRQKLQDLGALDIERPARIIGRSLSEECGLGDCVLGEEEKKDDDERMMDGDTKIIHFQRHGQGKSWIFVFLMQPIIYTQVS